jgi:hypothetical protein
MRSGRSPSPQPTTQPWRRKHQSLSHGYEDPHFVQAKPSLVVILNRADLFYPRNLARLIADKGGAKLAILPSDVGPSPPSEPTSISWRAS